MTVFFYDDYSEGAHPAVLDALRDANAGQEIGYGEDAQTRLAAERIAAAFGRDVAVHLVSGGTQANAVCLASMLRHHEAVLAAQTAHINVHEAGALEAAGHKIVLVDTPDGKLTPDLLEPVLAVHGDEHSVRPRVLALTQATETGLVYTPDELRALAAWAHTRRLFVYVDGARMAMAVAALAPAFSLAGLAECGADMLYLGGTKNGALCGEAVVIINPALREDFRYHMKQRGALLAKGRLLGAQFARLFADDGLWYELGRRANAQAARLAAGLAERGVALMQPQQINQVFAILPGDVVAQLRADFGFHPWRALPDGREVVRLVCSWATPDADVDRLLARVGELTAH